METTQVASVERPVLSPKESTNEPPEEEFIHQATTKAETFQGNKYPSDEGSTRKKDARSELRQRLSSSQTGSSLTEGERMFLTQLSIYGDMNQIQSALTVLDDKDVFFDVTPPPPPSSPTSHLLENDGTGSKGGDSTSSLSQAAERKREAFLQTRRESSLQLHLWKAHDRGISTAGGVVGGGDGPKGVSRSLSKSFIRRHHTTGRVPLPALSSSLTSMQGLIKPLDKSSRRRAVSATPVSSNTSKSKHLMLEPHDEDGAEAGGKRGYEEENGGYIGNLAPLGISVVPLKPEASSTVRETSLTNSLASRGSVRSNASSARYYHVVFPSRRGTHGSSYYLSRRTSNSSSLTDSVGGWTIGGNHSKRQASLASSIGDLSLGEQHPQVQGSSNNGMSPTAFDDHTLDESLLTFDSSKIRAKKNRNAAAESILVETGAVDRGASPATDCSDDPYEPKAAQQLTDQLNEEDIHRAATSTVPSSAPVHANGPSGAIAPIWKCKQYFVSTMSLLPDRPHNTGLLPAMKATSPFPLSAKMASSTSQYTGQGVEVMPAETATESEVSRQSPQQSRSSRSSPCNKSTAPTLGEERILEDIRKEALFHSSSTADASQHEEDSVSTMEMFRSSLYDDKDDIGPLAEGEKCPSQDLSAGDIEEDTMPAIAPAAAFDESTARTTATSDSTDRNRSSSGLVEGASTISDRTSQPFLRLFSRGASMDEMDSFPRDHIKYSTQLPFIHSPTRSYQSRPLLFDGERNQGEGGANEQASDMKNARAMGERSSSIQTSHGALKPCFSFDDADDILEGCQGMESAKSYQLGSSIWIAMPETPVYDHDLLAGVETYASLPAEVGDFIEQDQVDIPNRSPVNTTDGERASVAMDAEDVDEYLEGRDVDDETRQSPRETDQSIRYYYDSWKIRHESREEGGMFGPPSPSSDRTGVPSPSRASKALVFPPMTVPDLLPFRILGTSADDVSSTPHVLSPPLMESLQGFLPPAVGETGNFWLKYSLVRDGAALSTLLQYCRSSTHTILALETVEGEVLGSFTSKPWRSTHGSQYFGSGEAFLWRMRRPRTTPCATVLDQAQLESELDVFPWTGENRYVQYCTKDRLALGGGEVRGDMLAGGERRDDDDGVLLGDATNASGFGLVLDCHLLYGRSSPCATFNNPSLTTLVKGGECFEIVNVEVWALTPFHTVDEAERMENMKLFLEDNRL